MAMAHRVKRMIALMRLIDSLSPCRRFISSVFLGLSLIIAAGISARIIMTPHVLNQSTWEATGNARHLRRSWEAAKLPRLGRKLPVPSCDQGGLPTNVDPAIIFQCEAPSAIAALDHSGYGSRERRGVARRNATRLCATSAESDGHSRLCAEVRSALLSVSHGVAGAEQLRPGVPRQLVPAHERS